MVDLLESVKTENLEKQFNKYLPSVLDGEAPKEDRKPLTESVTSEHTGDKDKPSPQLKMDRISSKLMLSQISPTSQIRR